MLAGIGGRTIAEAKRNLSWQEANAWFRYIGLRGTINQGLRTEALIANVAVMIAAASNQKKKDGQPYSWHDFAPHVDKNEDMQPEDVTKKLLEVFRGK